MKKILTLILGIILAVGMLSGCSNNEISYVNLLNEFQQIGNTDVSGTVTLNVPKDLDITFTGEANVLENYFNLDISFRTVVNNKVIDIKNEKLVTLNDNLYVSKNLLKAYLEMTNTQTYTRRFDTIYKDVDFIKFSNFSLDEYKMIVPEETMKAFSEYFEDYKLKVVHSADNVKGYTLSVDTSDVNRIVEDTNAFISKNQSEFNDNLSYANVKKLLTPLTEIKDIRSMTADYAGSSLEHTISKYKTKYRNKVNLILTKNKENTIDFVLDLTCNLKDAITDFKPENVKEYKEISINDNDVSKVRILWNKDSNGTTKVHIYNYDDVISEETTYDYVMKEDRIYLPLRAICEKLGETVEWDAETDKAYIIRGEEKIDMTGMVVNDRTMIKIRDFEKLSYKITYLFNEYDEHTAIIEK